MRLTDKQEMFCREYVVDFNATQAAIRAGYSENGARTEGARLLANANIEARVSELKAEIAERNKMGIDEVFDILSKLARFDLADIYDENNNLKPIHQIPKAARLAIEGMDVEEHRVDGELISTTKKAKISNRHQALEKFMKHYGQYAEHNFQKNPELTREEREARLQQLRDKLNADGR